MIGPIGTLVSVNVGLPRDVEWRGRTVRTGIWKEPVDGRCSRRSHEPCGRRAG